MPGEPAHTDAAFESHRGRLLGLAYRMLASRAEAEDVVQDAWLRWSQTEQSAIENPEAYLVRVVTRLCLDRTKSARARREVYVGPWLPEPVADAAELAPGAATELADDLSFALLLVLDRMSPLERAAFLLHDVFDFRFAEVAELLGRSAGACRQLASRARRAVREGRPPPRPSAEHRRLLAAFLEATTSGDQGRLLALLRADAVALSDGGGRVAAARNPICGADKVARFLLGVARKQRESGAPLRVEWAELNGVPALEVWIGGALDQCVLADFDDEGLVSTLYMVRNPEKLGALGRRSPSQ